MAQEGNGASLDAGADGPSDGNVRLPLRETGDRHAEEFAQALAEIKRLRLELSLVRGRQAECDERFRTVLDQSIDVAYRRNLIKDRYDYLSPAIESITGFTVEEFSRISSADLFRYIHPDDHPAVMKRFGEFEQSRYGAKVSGLFEYRLLCKDGGYRWMSDSGVLVRGVDGSPLYHVGVARDITERKRMEEALRRSNVELEKTVAERTARLRLLADELVLAEQRERKRLSDYLHEDLQQELVAAMLRSEKLVSAQAEGPLKEEMRKLHGMLTVVLDKTRSMGRELVTPLLYMLGIVPALRQLIGQMEHRYGLQIALDAQEMPDQLSPTARTELYNAVRELLLNVVKHAATDKAVVSVRSPGGGVEIIVSDSGRGFETGPVLSGDAEPKGYGLFRVSERMAAMGGRMSVESTPFCGTHIVLSVSAAPNPVPLSGLQEAAGREGLREERSGRARVLVAEDNTLMRRGIVLLLSTDASLSVVGEAWNGRDAVELNRQLRPDVVVMDIRMPEMDGIEATRLIKAEFPETVVVGITAFSEQGFRTAMLAAGAEELIDKGDVAHLLSSAIARHLAARDLAGPGRRHVPAV